MLLAARGMRPLGCGGRWGPTVWVEHLSQELDGWRLVRVLLRELQGELECAVLPSSVLWPEFSAIQAPCMGDRKVDLKMVGGRSGGVGRVNRHEKPHHHGVRTEGRLPHYPKMTACHFMMSLSRGAPFTPSGGSFCMRLKSRISRRRAEVDLRQQKRSECVTVFGRSRAAYIRPRLCLQAFSRACGGGWMRNEKTDWDVDVPGSTFNGYEYILRMGSLIDTDSPPLPELA